MKELREDRLSTETKTLEGVGLAPGLVIGTAYKVEPRVPAFYRIRIAPHEIEEELERLHKALATSRDQLQQVKAKFDAQLGREHSYIIEAHILMLEDREFLGAIRSRIQDQLESPERAVYEIGERWLQIYRSLDDPFFQERGSDLREVVARVVANLMELDPHGQTDLPPNLVLVAPAISLSTLADYEVDRVKGLILTSCGRTSHVTIIARSYQIPVVSGIENVEEQVRTGETVAVDGSRGLVWVNPAARQIREFLARAQQEKTRSEAVPEDREPCVTSDGRQVFLYSNTEVGSEVPSALKLGAEGVGLFRTEYIYMKNKKELVSEEEQFLIYRKLAETVRNRPALVRTLDIGDGRHPYFSHLAGESNSVLGLRGIRLSLRFPEIFKSQVRAIVRASRYGNLKIILPMVSSVEEVLEARSLVREAYLDLQARGMAVVGEIDVGVMLEIPAAVLNLEALAAHADFLAVGTNDLIQYTLAVGRTNETVAHLFNPLHPAVLATLRRVAEVARKMDRKALICGEIASQPLCAHLLIGMGFQHLSMNPFAIPDIKKVVREMSYSEAARMVDQLSRLATVKEVEGFLNERWIPLTAEH